MGTAAWMILLAASAGAADPKPPTVLTCSAKDGRCVLHLDQQTGRSGTLFVATSGATRESRPLRVQIEKDAHAAWTAADGSLDTLAAREPSVPAEIPTQRPIANPAPDEATLPRGPLDRDFWLLRREGDLQRKDNYEQIATRLRAVGRGVRLYVDRDDLARTTDERLTDVVTAFEEMAPDVAELLGPCLDVDGDGRFAIVVTSRLDRLGRSDGGLDGLFRASDLQTGLPTPYSNQADVIFLNLRLGGELLRAIIAHECAHAAVASRRLESGAPFEEQWVDEAIAHVVEDRVSGSRLNVDHRVRAFLDCPERYGLVVADYFRSGLFRSHGHRGAAYLFLDFCVDQQGTALLGRLAAGPAVGVANLETAMGEPFETLHANWLVQLQGATRTPIRDGDDPIEWNAPAHAFRIFDINSPNDARITVETAADVPIRLLWVPMPLAQ